MLNIEAMNYFSGQMSADAAGITACLYLYSHLSFHTEGADQSGFQGCITACGIGLVSMTKKRPSWCNRLATESPRVMAGALKGGA